MTKTIFGKKLLILTTIAVLATGLTLATTLDYAEAKKGEDEKGNPVADAIDRLGLTLQGLPGLPGPSGSDGAAGENCSILDTMLGADITCGENTVSLFNGAEGSIGPVGSSYVPFIAFGGSVPDCDIADPSAIGGMQTMNINSQATSGTFMITSIKMAFSNIGGGGPGSDTDSILIGPIKSAGLFITGFSTADRSFENGVGVGNFELLGINDLTGGTWPHQIAVESFRDLQIPIDCNAGTVGTKINIQGVGTIVSGWKEASDTISVTFT